MLNKGFEKTNFVLLFITDLQFFNNNNPYKHWILRRFCSWKKIILVRLFNIIKVQNLTTPPNPMWNVHFSKQYSLRCITAETLYIYL